MENLRVNNILWHDTIETRRWFDVQNGHKFYLLVTGLSSAAKSNFAYLVVAVSKIRRWLQRKYYIDYNKNYQSTIFLAGIGRSGTTWVSEIINYRNEYRYIFEPFFPRDVDICKNFRYRQYIRPDNRDKKFIEPAKSILSGKLRNYIADYRNKKFFSNKRVIKDIRTNLLLKWLFVNFPGIQIILLFRHPCAVAYSKLKLNWNTHLEEFLSQEELVEDFLNPFKKEIEKAKSVFEKHIFLWCIENYVPLKQFNKGEIHLAFYENFCENPRYEIERLFSFLNKRFDEEVLMNLKNPSSLSRKESAIITGDSLINSWKKHITKEQIRRAIEILAIFGLDRIYAEDSIPNIENVYKLMNKSLLY